MDSESTNLCGPLSWGYGHIIWRGGLDELHQSVRVLLHFHGILHSEAGLSPSLMDHGTMSHLMFGLIKASQAR